MDNTFVKNDLGYILVEKEKVVVNTLEKKKKKTKCKKDDAKFF